MEKKKTIYTTFALLLGLSSCSHEGPADSGLIEGDSMIYFRSYLPSLSETRAEVITKENLTECFVTCFYPEDPGHVGKDTVSTYFSGKRFSKHTDGHFLADEAASAMWPNSKDRLHFFAFWPSVESMRNQIAPDGFRLANHSKNNNGTVALDYRMEGYKVAEEIADQVDFIAAYTSATQQQTGTNPIDIGFRHYLSRIELSAWGASEKYDFEIAGVRIGNPVTKADFNFTAMMQDSGDITPWIYEDEKHPSLVEHIFGEGESLVVLSKEKAVHSSSDEAASIMGAAGAAMVIPMAEKVEAWEGKADPKINDPNYSTDKLYFSVLLRVINRNNEVVYPYPNNCDFIPEYFFAVGSDGKIIRRLYKINDAFYTADKEADEFRYASGESEEICSFCWASLPVSGGAKWEPGKIYNYKLNYTKGIGWQDPGDPTPGEPIIERGLVPFEVNVEEWVEAEGHDPNLDVPKR